MGNETFDDPALVGLEQAGVVIANVSEGDWTKQTPEWQEAARRWRDEVWHALLADSTPKEGASE